MKKHDCHIDTGRKLYQGVNYFSHPIRANDKEGFIKGAAFPGWESAEPTPTLGQFYEYEGCKAYKPCWRWELYPFNKGGRTRTSNKQFSNKDEAIASLKKALDKKGYNLVDEVITPT